jgi:hypothetical protein
LLALVFAISCEATFKGFKEHSWSSFDFVYSRVSTNAEGSVIYVTEVQTLSRSSAAEDRVSTIQETISATDASSTSSAKSEDSSHGLSTGAIVGISVVAGVIVLGLVLFLVWKLKQKRFASFDDDDG